MIEQAIQEQAGFKISELSPENAAKSCECPAFFIHGKNDTFILPQHSEKNHAAYSGANKVLKPCDGDHNSERPSEISSDIAAFLKQNL